MVEGEPDWLRFTQSAFAVAGAGMGSSLSILVGDPLAGAMAGQAFAEIASELARRVLSPREEQRVGTVLVLAAGGVIANQTLGMSLRTDGFFDGARSDASEIIEGVLLAAKGEHEEKKLPYMANLLARMPFLEGMNVYALNQLIAKAETLSWLEMQLLAIVARPEDLPLPDVEYAGQASNLNDWAVTEAFTEMLNRGRLLLFAEGETLGEFTQTDLRMSKIKLGRLGLLLVDYMELGKIPIDDLRPICESLVGGAG